MVSHWTLLNALLKSKKLSMTCVSLLITMLHPLPFWDPWLERLSTLSRDTWIIFHVSRVDI